MNLKLKKAGEHGFSALVNRLAVTIDDRMEVLNYEGAGETFFKEDSCGKESTHLSDLLTEVIFEKLIGYLTQSLLIKCKVVSKYHLIHYNNSRLCIRFLIYPDPEAIPLTIILMESMTVDENTIIPGNPFYDENQFLKKENHKAQEESGNYKQIEEVVALKSNLEEQQARYSSLLAGSNDAIFILKQNIVIDCNKKALELLGLQREQIISFSPFYFSPEVQPDGQLSLLKIEEKIAQASQGEDVSFYWKFRNINHNPIEAEVSLIPFHTHTETLIHVIVKDITTIKEGERAIRDSESRFRAIFEGAGIGIALTDPYGKLIESNEALEDFLGYPKKELLGKTILEFVHPEDRDFENRYLIFYQGTRLNPGFFEKRYLRKDGSIVWGKLTTTVIHNEKGIPSYGVGMLENITQRKIAEEKVKENTELLNKINENLNEGIYRSTPGKGLVYANKAMAQMFGYSSVAEAMKLSSDMLNELYDEPDRRKYLLKEIRRKGVLKNKESLFRRKDGSTFWGLENSRVSTNSQGEMIIDGVIVDISERKNSEELLKSKNEELKKINEELDRFVYSASHDLRAPLTSLLGLINIAQTDHFINGISEHLELMKRSVVKLDSFIIDIINYSRNARLDLEVEKIDLESLVMETLDNLRYITAADKIEKFVVVKQTVPLHSDSKRIGILLSNLISNAIRYHNLILDAPYIKVTGKVTKKEVVLEIIDNGKGIGKQYLNNIFEMFFRASDDSKGSGLGLYIVKETINKLNGSVSVYSEVGKGSTFTVTFPNLPASKVKKHTYDFDN